MSKPILIVEDELKLAKLMSDYLEKESYAVDMIHRGDELLDWLQTHTPRLILLDVMLPGVSGLSLCKEIRKSSTVPIIIVTARVEEIDRLLGLELGADDYICKPFSPREVCARVAAVLRRAESSEATLDEAFQVDENKLEVSLKGQSVNLTAVEFRLLLALSQRPGWVFSRDKLMSTMYTDHRVISERTIDSHIKKLRKKLDELPFDQNPIHSIYGAGYKFE